MSNIYAPPLGTSAPRAAPAQAQALRRAVLFLVFLVVGLLVSVPAYMTSLAYDLRFSLRLGVPIFLFLVTLMTYTGASLKPYRRVALVYLAVSVGLLVVRYAGGLPLAWLGWSAGTQQADAVNKFGESWPLVAAILLFVALSGDKLSSLYLRRGDLQRSLIFGFAIGAFCFLPFVAMGGLQATLSLPPGTVLAWMPWLIAFSVVNGFTEELWFRGAWMSRIGEVLGPRGALHVTALIFMLMHVIVFWSQPYTLVILAIVWWLLGYACGWVTQKTNTIWGAVLGHAIADVLFMLGTYAGYGSVPSP